MAMIRRVVQCEACGTSVSINETCCPNCKSFFEPIVVDPYTVASASNNPFSKDDAVRLKPHLEEFEKFGHIRPADIDDLLELLREIKSHKYGFRHYLIDLVFLVTSFRQICLDCLDNSREARETQLEAYKRLEAVYIALSGEEVS